jgi:hypothetical protein
MLAQALPDITRWPEVNAAALRMAELAGECGAKGADQIHPAIVESMENSIADLQRHSEGCESGPFA